MKYLLIFFCVLLSSFFVYFPITDSDIFWHLAAGKEIFTHKHFLYTDPFSYTLLSPAWIDLHWLFQLLCYGLYAIGAENALIAFKLLCIGFTAALLCLTHGHKRYAVFCAFLTPLLFYHTRYLVDVRPVLMSMLLTAVYVFLFERTLMTGKRGLLWWLIPLQIIWTNCQGLYMIGLFIIGAYWIESAVGFLRKKNGRPVLHMAVLFACAASCLVNPYGVFGLFLPFRLFSRIAPEANNIYSLNISENVPLFSLTGFETGYRTAVIITAVIIGALFFCNWKKMRLSHVILFAGFFFIACCAVRNVTLYIIIAVPIIGHYAATADLGKRFIAMRPDFRRMVSLAAYSCALLMLLVPACRHAAVVALFPPHHALSPFRFPEKITETIKRDPVPGNMFNDIRYGGYLLWRLYPEKKVFIDTRLAFRPPEFFAEYLAISDRPELFAQVAEKFNITHAILPSALFTRHMKLIKRLYSSGRWRLEYTDGASVLFVRNDISDRSGFDLSNHATVQNIMDSIRAQWSDAPSVRREALGYFAGLLENLDLHEAAMQVKREDHWR